MNKCVKKVQAGSADKLQRILGSFDENLNIIMRELGVLIRVDGVTFVIEGAEDKALSASSVIESLLTLADNGETVDKGRVVYCIELSREGKAQDICKLSSGTVAITYRGKPIKCKTVGQKKYVDAINRDSITFGIGPAGTEIGRAHV